MSPIVRRSRLLSVLVLAGLALAACGGDDTTEAASESTSSAPASTAAATTSPDAETATDTATETPIGGSCDDLTSLQLVTPAALTVATGEPVFEPWMVDDDPSNGEGFESALVYALAEQMGFEDDQVTWVRTGFDEAIAPGDKEWDFNIQQYSITPERDEVVDFSDGYYAVEQAVVAEDGTDVSLATSVDDLAEARLGAALGTTSFIYAEEVIAPSADVLAFDDNADAKAALEANQVDALIFDVPTAYFVTAVEIPEASIVGVLPVADEADELGMLFPDGSELVPCVNQALATLVEDGTLDSLESEWLDQGGDIPTLTP